MYRVYISIFFVLHIFCVMSEPPQMIVGGYNAEVAEFPYMVSLRYKGKHFCGGNIIDAQHILTAAHCVIAHPVNGFYVVIGTNSLESGGEMYQIQKVIPHPYYSAQKFDTWKYDIGILKLVMPMTFSKFQKPINLTSRPSQSGSQAIVAGWGISVKGGSIPTKFLMKLYTTIGNIRYCESRMKIKLDDQQICTVQQYGQGACNGDSGSGLIVNGELAGIASFVIPCGLGYPDIYVGLYGHRNFILGQIQKTIHEHNLHQ